MLVGCGSLLLHGVQGRGLGAVPAVPVQLLMGLVRVLRGSVRREEVLMVLHVYWVQIFTSRWAANSRLVR